MEEAGPPTTDPTDYFEEGDEIIIMLDENGAFLNPEDNYMYQLVIDEDDSEKSKSHLKENISTESSNDSNQEHTPSETENGNGNKIIFKHSTEDKWTDKATRKLLSFYIENLQILNRENETSNEKWKEISKLVRKTVHSCLKHFYKLRNVYYDMIKNNKFNESWPWMNDFMKICDYEPVEIVTEKIQKKAVKKKLGNQLSAKPVEGKTCLLIVQHYLKYQNNFDKADTTQKLHLWGLLGDQIGVKAVQCEEIFQSLKDKKYKNKPENALPYKKVKLLQTWQRKEVKELLAFYADNVNLYQNATKKDFYGPVAKKLNRSEHSCYCMAKYLISKHKMLLDMRINQPNMPIYWKYFDMVENMYNKDVEESDQEDKVSEILMMENAIQKDDSTECIMIVPELSYTSTRKYFKKQFKVRGGIPDVPTDFIRNSFNGIFANDVITKSRVKRKPVSIETWRQSENRKLLKLYKENISVPEGTKIDERKLFKYIASHMRKPMRPCYRQFIKLKKEYLAYIEEALNDSERPYNTAIWKQILLLEPTFINRVKTHCNNKKEVILGQAVSLKKDTIENILKYYYNNLEEFLSPKFYQSKSWKDMADLFGETVHNCKETIACLKKNHISNMEGRWEYFDIMEAIIKKEDKILADIASDPILDEDYDDSDKKSNFVWSDKKTAKFLDWYCDNVDKFKNPKYIQKFLWREAAELLGVCVNKCARRMRELKVIYRKQLMKKKKKGEIRGKYFDKMEEIFGTDLDEPLLARTNIIKPKFEEIKVFKGKNAKGKDANKSRVLPQAMVFKIINFYIDNYAHFKDPLMSDTIVWQAFVKKYKGVTSHDCIKKINQLKSQYFEKFCIKSECPGQETEWPFYEIMCKVNELDSNN